MANKYDYFVIGSGPAGHVSAIKAAQLGLKVGVAEKGENMFGGVCLNEGCIPAKSLYNSAKIYDIVKNASSTIGCEVDPGKANMTHLVERSRRAATQLKEGLEFLFKKNGIKHVRGKAEFLNAKSVKVGDLVIESDKFLIATGSSPCELADVPVDGKNVLSSSHAIKLEKVPAKVLIIGAGAIGSEFASFFNIVGSSVTLLEAQDRILPTEDKEISKRMQTIFKKSGIEVMTSSIAKEVKPDGSKVKVLIESKTGKEEKVFDKVIVSVGRRPNTSGLGLEKAGVQLDDKGFVIVDKEMRTSVQNIFAAGDVLETPMLAHVASSEGEVAAEVAAGKDAEPIDLGAVPNAVYTHVPAASVGMTEEKAKEAGIDYSVGKQFFKANGKAVATGETEGFIKVIADNATHKVLGAHIIGHEATELIHEFVLAKKAGILVDDIEKMVHAHPTFSETAMDACRSVFGKAINS